MNIGTLLTKSAGNFPERLAICSGDREWTYAETNERVNRLASGLTDLGLKKDDHVAILHFNCPQFIETLFACFKAGLAVIPINFRLHPKEYRFIIDQSDSVTVVFGEDFADSLQSLRKELPKVKHYICFSNSRDYMLDYEKLVRAHSPDFDDVEVDRNDLAWLFYTSGTTGSPKGAMLSHGNLLAMTMSFFADMSFLGPDDAVLHAAPLSHGSGLYSLPNIAKGANNVILEGISCGLPVLSTDLPSIKYYVPGNEAILIKDNDPAAFAEALLQLSNNREKLSSMSDLAYERAHELSWEKIAREYEQLYLSLR